MKARDIVAWNVRERRVKAGLSQEAFADAAGINRTFVSDIEQKKVAVTVDLLDRLALFFQVAVCDLLRQPAANDPKPQPLTAGRKQGSIGKTGRVIS